MNFYSLRYGLQASANQSEIVQWLKSRGAEAIQTSDGLCVKSEESLNEIQALLTEKGVEGVQLTALDPQAVAAQPETAEDVKAFVLEQV